MLDLTFKTELADLRMALLVIEKGSRRHVFKQNAFFLRGHVLATMRDPCHGGSCTDILSTRAR